MTVAINAGNPPRVNDTASAPAAAASGAPQVSAPSTSQKINTLAIVVLGRFLLPAALAALGIAGSKYLSATLKSQTSFTYSPLVKTLGKCSVTYLGWRAAEASAAKAKAAVKSIPAHTLMQYIFQDLLGGALSAGYNYLTQDAIDTRIEQTLLTAVTGQDDSADALAGAAGEVGAIPTATS